jgi:GH25 family lysozyme M1 (1,4-beta-N-acetylmuramidase)
MKKSGIDISRYQGKPDFSKLKNEVDFVIVQAGFGRYASQKDAQFERSYSECKKYGIPVGVYWYSYAKTAADALAEARACMEVIAGKTFEYPIYYDLEEGLAALGRNTVSAIAAAFCNALEQAGYFAGIYISRSPAQSYLTAEVCGKYALWLAEYGSKLNWSGAVGMWQNSSTGRFSGISGDVDTDICYEDYPKLIKAAGRNGFPKSDPALKPLDTAIWYKRGDKDKDGEHTIFTIKQRLKALGCKVDDTGGFGGGTEAAVKELQQSWGFEPTGEIGENFVKRVMK